MNYAITKLERILHFKNGISAYKGLRVSKTRNNICANLLLPLEGPYIIVRDHNVNSYVLKYLDSEKVRGVFDINDIFEFKTENEYYIMK